MELKTDIDRWQEISQQEQASWGGRNSTIAGFIPDGKSVLDIGAGNMNLQKVLPENCTYQPMDCIPTLDTTIVHDFNSNAQPPELKFDVVVCSGVMEYIEDPQTFLKTISEWGSTIILSYGVTDYTPTRAARANNGWFTDLSEADVARMIKATGMVIKSKSKWSSQILFVINSPAVREEPEPVIKKVIKQKPKTEIENKYEDDACYIVGGGPSLIGFDWTLLDDKFTIALNMTHIMLPKADVIYCTDPPWIAPNAATLTAHAAPVWQGVLRLNNPPKLPCVDKQWHLVARDGLTTKTGCMSHGSNSTYAAVNLAAVHLGFKKIYLLGIDLKWGTKGKKETSHWHSDTKPHARIDSEGIYTTMKTNFKSIKQPLRSLGVEVINVNTKEGTDLDVFPIKSKEEVFDL